MEFVGIGTKLSDKDIRDVAKDIGCEVEVIKAVMDVESGGSGFLPDNRPKILFEAHVFSRLTDHKFDDEYPNISSRVWNRSLYGPGGSHQYDRLNIAIGLDRRAGLNSSSWGMFQILGLNDGQCGYDDVEIFIEANIASEKKQLELFEDFCVNGGMIKYLINKDWVRFALRYNGSGEAMNHYHEKLENAYLKYKNNDYVTTVPDHAAAPNIIGLPVTLRKGDKGELVKKLQSYLLGVKIDGDFGGETEKAVMKFQMAHDLTIDGVVGPKTWKELTND